MRDVLSAIQKNRQTGMNDFLVDDLLLETGPIEKIKGLRLCAIVHESGIIWSETEKLGMYTGWVSLRDLFAAKLYYSETLQEVDETFLSLAQKMPGAALDILENGIARIGRQPIRKTPSLHALVPLLRHPSKDIRTKTMLLLGKEQMRNTSPEGRSLQAGSTRHKNAKTPNTEWERI